MNALFHNRLAYLSVSLVLLMLAFPLISHGLTEGPPAFWWLGLLSLTLGGMIPPLQRLLLGPTPSTHTEDDDTPSPSPSPSTKGSPQ